MDYRQRAALNAPRSLIASRPWLWLLIVLLALTLFPFGWLGDVWPAFGAVLGRVFATDLAHAIGHSLIFCILGGVLLQIFPALLTRPWRYLGLMLLAGVAQEAFQLLYKRRPLAYDDFRDLAVDSVAFLATFAAIRAWRRVRDHKAGRKSRFQRQQ